MSPLSQNQSALSNPSGSQVSSNVVSVTPSLAEKWLQGMIKNQRGVSGSTVLKYSRAMKEGKWKLAAPLSFDTNGQLIDGQHRLHAVIKADKPIDFIVLQGLHSDAIQAIDMGINRTSAHLAKLQGLDLTIKHFSLLNCCFFCPTANLESPSFSKQEQVEIASKHLESLNFALSKRQNDSISYAPYLASVARAYYSENHKRLEQFLQVLHSGFTVSENPSDDAAAIALRNLHFKSRQTSTRLIGGREVRMQANKIATQALANFILRKPIKVLKESSINHFPVGEFDAWWKAKELK
jgi:hypothetical protein